MWKVGTMCESIFTASFCKHDRGMNVLHCEIMSLLLAQSYFNLATP